MAASDSSITEPLLQQQVGQEAAAGDVVVKDKGALGEAGSDRGHPFLVEAKRQLALAAPMIIVNLLQCSITTISVMFVGHLGELSLASSSISSSFAAVTGLSVMVGLASGLETLCGQAFGAKQYRMVGIYMQRGAMVELMVAVVVAVLWLNMSTILKLVGQDPEISDKAGQYIACLIPVVFAHAFLQPMQRFLQMQAIILPMMLCAAATAVVHLFVCWLLVYRLGVGFLGAALASSISVWFNTCLTALYIKLSPRCRKTWTGLAIREAWQEKTAFFKLAVPATIMVCLEWWSFELLVILSGLLPNPQLELSALSICINSVYLSYMVPLGLSTVASTRVSNEVGAGRPYAARFAAFVVLVLASISAVTISSILFSLRNIWGKLYSNEEEVIAYVSSMIPFICILTLMDGYNNVLSGVARGCGWQHWGAWINLGAYYIVGLPAAITLAFAYHLNGKGLWIGLLGGIATQLSGLLLITVFTNWNQQVENAKIRIGSSVAATLPIQQAPSEPSEHQNGKHHIDHN